MPGKAKKDIVHMYKALPDTYVNWHADYWAKCGALILFYKISGLWKNVTCKECLKRRVYV